MLGCQEMIDADCFEIKVSLEAKVHLGGCMQTDWRWFSVTQVDSWEEHLKGRWR